MAAEQSGRVVQLVGDQGWMTAASTVNGITSFGQLPDLSFFDGAGGYFTGTASAQSISQPVVSDTPCWNESLPTTSLRVTCRRAQFTASFAGTVSPSPLTGLSSGAAGTRTLAMTSQRLAGVQIVIGQPSGGQVPPPSLPPISVRGPVLPATLTAAVEPAGVTCRLTITNTGAAPAELRFSSGQQYDFAVRRADGTAVWRWSAGMGFIAALTSRTLAAGESVAYTATWSNATSGSYVVVGALTSMSHRAEATTSFVVP